MKVKLMFFAGLREQLGTSGEEIELPAGVTTLAGIREHLKARGGNYERVFAGKALVRVALNQEMAQPTAPVKAGDEIAFFPPVTGG
ncbi:MAG: molybdopterin converting factor subunit 1 [Burkholderiales bacterium]